MLGINGILSIKFFYPKIFPTPSSIHEQMKKCVRHPAVGKRRENERRFSATHIFTFCSISSAFFTIGAFQRTNSKNIWIFGRFWGSLKLKKRVNLVRFWRFYEILWDSTEFCEILKILRDSEDSMRFLRFWKDS